MNSDTIYSIIQRIRVQAAEEMLEASETLDLLEDELEAEFNFYE